VPSDRSRMPDCRYRTAKNMDQVVRLSPARAAERPGLGAKDVRWSRQVAMTREDALQPSAKSL
jgi:hypothetical protein